MKHIFPRISIFSFFLLLCSIQFTVAQAPKRYSASEIQLALKKLNVLGSALYMAAHPDDENQQLITYMANERLMRSAYLSLTRGDGGQNLVGPEIREQLGVIRTQELLEARRLDGGQQFFTRANDFGYSKTADETLKIWDKEQVFSDVVWVVRNFRPDVIITRFPPNKLAGHGHHTSSAMLAIEAYQKAGDPKVFPEQLKYVEPWQPKRVMWNSHPFFFRPGRTEEKFDSAAYLMMDLNQYNQLLGKSYSEIAAQSRSNHKSQGFGATGTRGEVLEFFSFLTGSEVKEDLLEGIDLSWGRVKGGENIQVLVRDAYGQFDPENPSGTVPALLDIRQLVDKLEDQFWRKEKLRELDELLVACTGLYMEAVASESSATPGAALDLSVEVVNRSPIDIKLLDVRYLSVNKDTVMNHQLLENKKLAYKTPIELPGTLEISQPYWLKKPSRLGMYQVNDQRLIGLPENDPAFQVTYRLHIVGHELSYTRPVVYKRNDPVNGETYKPFVITPPVYVSISGGVHIFASGESKNIEVIVKSGKADTEGKVRLQVPKGWNVSPGNASFALSLKGDETTINFKVSPRTDASVGEISATVTIGDEVYYQSLVSIEYDHIRSQTLFPEAKAKVVKLDIRKEGQNIGYVMGAGDDIPNSLEQIGYMVTLLQDGDFQPEKLQKFDAIILGIRAYNTVDRLKYHQPKLIDYVENGGTLIVQYNTNFRLVTENIAPYELKISRDRVSVEEAQVRILKPDHVVMNKPNKITEADFDEWVQERGLYFPNEWDNDNFVPILSSNDPGEEPKDGGLLVAKYGKGYYIYTGYSWFRELPAGVPGAYRVFTNMISIGK